MSFTCQMAILDRMTRKRKRCEPGRVFIRAWTSKNEETNYSLNFCSENGTICYKSQLTSIMPLMEVKYIEKGKAIFKFPLDNNRTILVENAPVNQLRFIGHMLNELAARNTIQYGIVYEKALFQPGPDFEEMIKLGLIRNQFNGQIRTIHVEPGSIKQLHPHFHLASSLCRLVLRGNNFLENTKLDDCGIFKCLKHLASIDVSSCEIGNVPTNRVIVLFESLQFLDFSRNPVIAIPRSFFGRLYNYEAVILYETLLFSREAVPNNINLFEEVKHPFGKVYTVGNVDKLWTIASNVIHQNRLSLCLPCYQKERKIMEINIADL
ncbi:unnamed protein product [Caenorhabditis bovis]|uniref:Uncharacterized protein n=1 Tax=Caenorhabditis bovis TaxID=2654633 RepID=A0A8S1EZW8_9PELO|nr:unnamed protein product [Caenorhabditis bovis]